MTADYIPEKYKDKLFLTVQDIRDIMGIGVVYSYDFVNSGKFRTERVGRKILVNAKSFWDWYGQENS